MYIYARREGRARTATGSENVERRKPLMETIDSSLYKNSIKLESKTASLYVQSTGSQQCAAGYGWGPGVRSHFLLHHVVGGRGAYQCLGTRYELSAGDTFMIFPGATVQYAADPADPWEYIWVGFSGLEAESLVAMTGFTPEAPVLRAGDTDELRTLMTAVYISCGPQPWEGLDMTARLYLLMSYLVRTSGKAQSPRHDPRDCAQIAAEYIVNHYEEPLTVEELAKIASVSHSSLYRRFVKRYQISPKRFLLEYRIERACAMLSTTDCTVQEVSNSVGFDDPFYFSRLFKEVKGVSPRRYAARERGTETD